MIPMHRLARVLVAALVALLSGSGGAAPNSFTDPTGAPGAWPDGLWWPYTVGGAPLFDESAAKDPSTGGTTPTGSVDLILDNAAFYYSDGTHVYLRFGIDGPPLALSGSSQPFVSATWSILMDTDGDGYREFAIMLSGIDSSGHAQPDDIIVMYSDDASQAHRPATQTLWRQDSGRHPTDARGAGIDGEPGGAADWDSDPDPHVWDFGRTRVSQRDTSRNPGSNNSTYWLDLQVPMAALDARALGGPALTSGSLVRFVFSSANSNTNPAQKDFTFFGAYTFNDLTAPLPFGDVSTFEGRHYRQSVVTRVTSATACGSSVTLSADVAGSLEPWGGDRIRTDVRQVRFRAMPDRNANGVADDGEAWFDVATVTMTATDSSTSYSGGSATHDIGPWNASWNPSVLPQGQYLLKVVATTASGLVTDSTDTVSASPSYNPATYGAHAVVGTFVNGCGRPPVTLTKSVDVAEASAGGSVDFTLTIDNGSADPVALNGLSDDLPQGFSYQSTVGGSLTPATSPADGTSGNVSWTFSATTVPPGGSATLVFRALVANVVNTYSNTARADSGVGTLTSNAVEIGVGAPELTLGAVADTVRAAPGQVVSYTFTYSNDSPVNAEGVILEATLPAHLTYRSGGSYDPISRNASWSVGDLPSGDGPYSVTLQGEVTSPYPASDPLLLLLPVTLASPTTAAVTREVQVLVDDPRPRLGLQLSSSAALVAPGGQVTLSFDYHNLGSADATAAALSYILPNGFSWVSGGSFSGNTVSWALGTLAPNETGKVTVTVAATTPYGGATPSVHSGTLVASEAPAVSHSVGLGVQQTSTCVSTTWYFTGIPYGTGTGDFTATTTAPTTATGFDRTVAIGSAYPAWEPIVDLYQDPANGNEIDLGVSIDTTFYITKDNTPLDLKADVYDLDPSTGSRTLLGTSDASTNPAMGLTGTRITNAPITFSVPTSGSLSKGHRLVWEFFGRTKNSNSFTFHMNSTGSPSASSYCISPPADLALIVTAGAASVAPGDTPAFTADFSNAGQSNATNPQLTLTLPAGLSFLGARVNGVATAPTSSSGRSYTFAVYSRDSHATTPQITGGAAGTLVVDTSVDTPTAAVGGDLEVAAELVSDQTLPVVDSASLDLRLPLTEVSKSVDRTRLLPGERSVYTVVVTNRGSAAADATTVRDILPQTPYYRYVAGSARRDGVAVAPDPLASDTLTFELGRLEAGASATLDFTMEAATSGVPQGVTRLASAATVEDAASVGTRTSDEVAVTLNSNPILRIDHVIAPAGPVSPGTLLSHTVTISNIGASDAENVSGRHLIPADTSFVSGSIALDGVVQSEPRDGDAGSFDPVALAAITELGTLASGSTRTVSYRTTVNTPLPAGDTPITGSSSVSAGNAATRNAVATVTAHAAPQLNLIQSAPLELPLVVTTLVGNVAGSTSITVADASYLLSGERLSVNGTVAGIVSVTGTTVTLDSPVSGVDGDAIVPVFTYRLSLSNDGSADASHVVVDTVLPAGLEYLAADPTPALAPAGGGNGALRWTLANVPAGSTLALSIDARPASSGTFTSRATAASDETAPVDANDVTVNVGMLRTLKITPTPAVTTHASGGGEATYVITVENTLANAVTDVSITDVLPPGFTYARTVALGGGSCLGPSSGVGVATWSGCVIAGGATLTIEFLVAIDGSVGNGTYDNVVRTDSDQAGVMQFRSRFLDSEDVTVTRSSGAEVSGRVFHDLDGDRSLDAGEDWSGGVTVTVNLLQGGTVARTLALPPGSGAFSFSAVGDGSYTLIVATDAAATTAAPPAGWLLLAPDDGSHTVTVAGSDVSGLDFALFEGSRVSGTVFHDHGAGAGSANDALRNGDERGVSGVALIATNGILSQTATTDDDGAYSLLLPASWGSRATIGHDLRPATGISDGSSALYRAGSGDDADAGRTVIDPSRGVAFVRDFGTVANSAFTPDHSGQSVSPGSVSYVHLLRPGTLGSVALAAEGSHRYEFFLDEDCDGTITAAERIPVSEVTVDARWPRSPHGALRACGLELRVLVDSGAPVGRTDIAALGATLSWANSAVTEVRGATDTTVIRESGNLSLDTEVRNVTTGSPFARLGQGDPGHLLEYCTRFHNLGATPLDAVEIRLPIPPFTEFLPNAYGPGADVALELNGVSSFGSGVADADPVTRSGRLVAFDQGTLLPADEGRLCLRAVIQ